MLCQCNKPYNDNINAVLTSNNQCSIDIVVTVAHVWAHATGAANTAHKCCTAQ